MDGSTTHSEVGNYQFYRVEISCTTFTHFLAAPLPVPSLM